MYLARLRFMQVDFIACDSVHIPLLNKWLRGFFFSLERSVASWCARKLRISVASFETGHRGLIFLPLGVKWLRFSRGAVTATHLVAARTFG